MSSSLRSFFDDHFAPLFLRGRSIRTKQLYLTTLRNLESYLGRSPTLADLTDDSVSRFLSWFRLRPRSPYSTNKERSNLLAIWRFAARKKFLDHWPDVKPEVEPKRIPRAWTEVELRKLIESCQKEAGFVAGVLASDWWVALHLVAWDSGEQITAIMALTWGCFDLNGGWLHVPAELRKGKRADRVYRLAADTMDVLKKIRLPKRPLVFPWVLCRNYLWGKYEPILERAGLPTDRLSKFHRMRKSVGSHYEARGGNATELFGHSSRKTTLAYLDPRITGEKHAADVLFRITSQPPPLASP